MKKMLLILVAVIGFGFSVNAQSYKCNRCNDTKTITITEICHFCKGTAEIDCKKTREVTCTSCKGKGTVDPFKNGKTVTCNWCKGTGKSTETYTAKCPCNNLKCSNGKVSRATKCPSCM